jgi:transcriptional regulator with XRE-family HTH domain
MLGDTVRQERIRKGLTQARLAKLAGVSRRHLAALEKGANVSVSILQRVSAVLELTEIRIGDLHLRATAADRGINVPLLTDTIREARADAERAQATLARVETLLGAGNDSNVVAMFPRMPPRLVDMPEAEGSASAVHERPELVEVPVAGEIRHGHPIDETRPETVLLPKGLVDEGEIVFRARGTELEDQGILEGDLLIVELRTRGRAASGELVIGRIGEEVFIGRWWQKHGRKALLANGLAEVTVGRNARALKIVAAVNQIVRVSS